MKGNQEEAEEKKEKERKTKGAEKSRRALEGLMIHSRAACRSENSDLGLVQKDHAMKYFYCVFYIQLLYCR